MNKIDLLARAMRDFAIKEQLALSFDNLPWDKLPDFRKNNWRKRAQNVLDFLSSEQYRSATED